MILFELGLLRLQSLELPLHGLLILKCLKVLRPLGDLGDCNAFNVIAKVGIVAKLRICEQLLELLGLVLPEISEVDVNRAKNLDRIFERGSH